MYRRLQARVLMLICLRVLLPKGYHRGSLGKSQQFGDYLKQAMRKRCPPTRFKTAAFGLPVHCSIT